MADESWAIGFAIGVQTGFGSENSTIDGLGGALGVTDGIVLGDRDSGEADSGIVKPNHVRIEREVADVSGSFTKQGGSFTKQEINSLSITIQVKGNGALSTPLAGEFIPDAGIAALWEIGGMIGADGAGFIHEYTPRIAATSPSTRYATIKLWIADLSFTLKDCICSRVVIRFEPGGLALATFEISVGSVFAAVDGVTFPTFAYGNQASLSAPALKGITNTWGTVKSYQDLTVTIENNITDIPDVAAGEGVRKVQDGRRFIVDGVLFVDTADSDFEYQNLIGTAAPTADLSFQLGTVAGATDVINAMLVELLNLQAFDIKYEKSGDVLGVTLAGAQATGITAGGEAKLTYN